MAEYKVKTFFKRADVFVTLHDKEILPSEDLKSKEGCWAFSLSPWDRTCFEPHYSVSVDDHDGEISTLYKAEFFVTDMEYDAFVVEVVHVGECETHLHINHEVLLDADLLAAIADTVGEIEYILPQIAKQHDKALGIDEDVE